MKTTLTLAPLVLALALHLTSTQAAKAGFRREGRSVRTCLRIFCDHNETCFDCAKSAFWENKESVRECVNAFEKDCDRMPSTELHVLKQCVVKANPMISNCFVGVLSMLHRVAGQLSPPCVSNLHPGVSNLHPGVSNLRPGVGNLHPGISNLHPALQTGFHNRKPGVSTLQPGMSTLQPGITSLPPSISSLHPTAITVQPPSVGTHTSPTGDFLTTTFPTTIADTNRPPWFSHF
ncbi:uncharacterized protein [Cherax quadricarinatus]|nr:splicing factor 3A subunit 2-like [Cherax quadricarinatus]